jgi:hypothetical protein
MYDDSPGETMNSRGNSGGHGGRNADAGGHGEYY